MIAINIEISEQINKLKLYKVEKCLDSFQALIFPPVCGICGKLNENYLCNRCNLKLKKQAKFKVDSYITKTGFRRKYFDEHIYFFKYNGLIREQIIDYKFNDQSYKYKAISNFILKNFILKVPENFQIINNYDVIISVPISSKRFKQRGYNQSLLIAKEISKALGKSLNTKSLYKSKNIIAQSYLNKEQREENIKNVYILKNEKALLNKKVLLIDDIYTTGSTANECCKVLQKAKPKKVGVLTVAKD